MEMVMVEEIIFVHIYHESIVHVQIFKTKKNENFEKKKTIKNVR